MEWKILLLLLVTAISCSGGSSVYGRRIRPTTDLEALESSTDADTVVAPPDGMEDEVPSESKRSEVFRDSGRTLVKPPSGFKFSVQNVTNAKYNYMQWYAEPKGQSQNHHANRNKGSEDLSAQSSSYSEGYTQGQIDYHHHHDEPRSKDVDHHYHYDHFHEVATPSPLEYEEKKLYSSYETTKPRTRKLRKKCSKDKNKEGLSTNADTLVHSMTKQTGAEVTQFDIRSPLGGGGGGQANLKPSGFSPSTVGGKTIDNGNHLHIHSHHYHYDAEGNKKVVGAEAPALRNIVQGIQKLLPLALSGVSKLNHMTQSGKPMMDPATADVKLAEEGPKKGYHYTGPHNSYGRKTYLRMKDSNSPSDNPSSFDGYSNPPDTPQSGPFGGDSYGDSGSSDLPDHSSNMFNYGPFATDEYRDGSGPFPNEVSLSVDRPHSDEKPGYDKKPLSYDGYDKKPLSYDGYDKKPSSYDGYDSGSHEHPRDYHDDYPHPNPGYNSDGPSYSSEGPSYNNNGGVNPISSAEYNNNDNNKPYVPYDDIKANREKNAVFVGYGKPDSYSQADPSYGKQPETESYSHPHSSDKPLSHSFSYSGIDELMYDPEKHRDLRPEPDPLTIPKNARVIEHHIRLDPKIYTMYPPLDFTNHQHIPLHKLIPDPLKSPYPQAHPAQGYHHHNPQLNQMLQAYQSRSVYHKWW